MEICIGSCFNLEWQRKYHFNLLPIGDSFEQFANSCHFTLHSLLVSTETHIWPFFCFFFFSSREKIQQIALFEISFGIGFDLRNYKKKNFIINLENRLFVFFVCFYKRRSSSCFHLLKIRVSSFWQTPNTQWLFDTLIKWWVRQRINTNADKSKHREIYRILHHFRKIYYKCVCVSLEIWKILQLSNK